MSKPNQVTFLETMFLDGNLDTVLGFIALFVGGLIGLTNYRLGIVVGISIGAYFLLTFFWNLLTGEKDINKVGHKFDLSDQKPSSISPTTSAPLTDESTIADRIKEIHVRNDFKCPNCGAIVLPTDIRCKHCDSVLVATADLPRPNTWADVEIGQEVQVKHPKKGNINLTVTHRIYYGELWQAKMRPDVPWTLTGNYFVALRLGENISLMNWQTRFYLLDSQETLTDTVINRDFAQPARKFASSNQTVEVRFQYGGSTWQIEDIGRFRIEFAEGDGIKVSPGAIGRFIHARHNNQILVVEDYQTGGSGHDTLWKGYQIEEGNIKM